MLQSFQNNMILTNVYTLQTMQNNTSTQNVLQLTYIYPTLPIVSSIFTTRSEKLVKFMTRSIEYTVECIILKNFMKETFYLKLISQPNIEYYNDLFS